MPQQRVSAIEAKQVEILAAIQAHLRDQEHKSLIGTAGAERLRAELRDTVNRELGRKDVRDVLFTHLRLDWARNLAQLPRDCNQRRDCSFRFRVVGLQA
ncbi:MAG: flagellar basal body-associated FliL family protein [Defluviicoccus sp.]